MDKSKWWEKSLGKIVVDLILLAGRIIYGIFRMIFAFLSALA